MRPIRPAILLALLTVFSVTTRAQQPAPAVARIVGPDGSGSAVIVQNLEPVAGGFLSIAVTAGHVCDVDLYGTPCPPGTLFELVYSSGRRCKTARVLARDPENDLAALLTWSPDDVAPITIADRPQLNRPATVIGWPGHWPGCQLSRSATTRHTENDGDYLWTDATVYPGDSGGAILDEQGQLIGIVSGGLEWMDSTDGSTPTWPLRSGTVQPIRKLVAAAIAAKNAGQ